MTTGNAPPDAGRDERAGPHIEQGVGYHKLGRGLHERGAGRLAVSHLKADARPGEHQAENGNVAQDTENIGVGELADRLAGPVCSRS
jgi:hypothetical protein